MRPTPVWIERLARVGIAAKAIVYLTIGSLATAAALELGGIITGVEGFLRLVLDQPMGRALLGLLAFGFAAYTLWLFAQAVVDPDGNGTSLGGLLNRLGQVITGVAHVAITWTAARLALGMAGGVGRGIEDLVAGVLEAPMGSWVLRLAGLVVIVVGLSQIWRALFGDVRRNWRLGALDPERDRVPLWLGRFGLAARGAVLAVGGVLVLRAAAAYDPDRAGGLGEVLGELARQPASHWLLGGVALGLVAYGCFGLVEARYRFIPST